MTAACQIISCSENRQQTCKQCNSNILLLPSLNQIQCHFPHWNPMQVSSGRGLLPDWCTARSCGRLRAPISHQLGCMSCSSSLCNKLTILLSLFSIVLVLCKDWYCVSEITIWKYQWFFASKWQKCFYSYWKWVFYRDSLLKAQPNNYLKLKNNWFVCTVCALNREQLSL
jgi:hypothetical protein